MVHKKNIINMVKRNANSISFFKATSELIERKYKLGTCSVAKSGLSTLCKIEEFLNLNSGTKKVTVIERINESSRKRIVQMLNSEYSRAEQMLGTWAVAVIHLALYLWDEVTYWLKECKDSHLVLFKEKKDCMNLETLKSEVTLFFFSSYLVRQSNDILPKATKTI
tara:strand:+ start:549 stop:1046 length:498 start_codon:yes stop_codon:yes gene_type:complete